jgi:hypothetical protein
VTRGGRLLKNVELAKRLRYLTLACFKNTPVVLLAAFHFSNTSLFSQEAAQVAPYTGISGLRSLPGHIPRWANSNNFERWVSPDRMMGQMTVVLSRTAEQEQALEKLLSDQQNPASTNHHRWLTPTELGERFGPSTEDIESISEWLQAQGLRLNWVSPSRTSIGFSGTARAVGRAFHTDMRYYRVHGALRFSVSSAPAIPEALAPLVKAVRGLSTLDERPLHHATTARSSSPELTAGNSAYYLAPADFATIYDLPDDLTGAGITIGIVGLSRTDFADLENFRQLTGSTFGNPAEIVPTAFGGVDPGPALTSPPAQGVATDDQAEATLDVLRAGSVAPGASLLLVVATADSGGIGADAEYLVDTDPVPVQILSMSFGACESDNLPAVAYWNSLFKNAAAEGISVLVASGDSGASGCDSDFSTPPVNPSPNSPNFLCSSSYATCVGGTELSDAGDPSLYWSPTNGSGFSSALGPIPEGAWNEPLNSDAMPQVAASGGGVSAVIPTPAWQVGAGVPAARSGRYTPDISFSASGHDGYFGCFAAGGGNCVVGAGGYFYFNVFAGTSASVQDMAGVAALLDQKLGSAQGDLSPGLYRLAANTPSAFHDVTVATSGVTNCDTTSPSMCNNSIPGPASSSGGQAGFPVTVGYDEVTGLGSLDVAVFVENYVGVPAAPVAWRFIPVTPCRVADTRNAAGPFGGPALGAGAIREFDIPQGGCKIPGNAVAYSLNVTVVPDASLKYLTLWPSGQEQPYVSTLNSDGRVKADAAIVPAGDSGGVSVYVTDPTEVVLDIDGYFVPSATATALAFYPVTPCRVADTRNPAGPLGGPFLSAGGSRAFPMQSSNCTLPASAQAYSLNVTAIPHSTLKYLTLWPSGKEQPQVSTLNSSTGAVTANAAIVAAGNNGEISVFVSDAADVALDVNGYFAPAVSGGLSLYAAMPCRVIDTRPVAFTGTTMVSVEGSRCAPPAAGAYVLNATAVPADPLNYLTLWAASTSQPHVSTLNAPDEAITSNMAIVPANSGAIEAHADGTTNLVLDIFGYFAP